MALIKPFSRLQPGSVQLQPLWGPGHGFGFGNQTALQGKPFAGLQDAWGHGPKLKPTRGSWEGPVE